MAAKSFLRLVSGKITSIQAVVTSAGAGNDGDIIALDSSGKIDVSVLPVGVGPDVASITVSEAAGLAAGDYVNIFDSTGEKVRLADNSNNRPAHGFVKSAFADAATAIVYFEGPNDDLTGMTPGARQYLGTAGGHTATPLVPVTDAGKSHQFLGIAINATTINTDIDDVIQL